MHCGVTEFNLNRDKERKVLVASGVFMPTIYGRSALWWGV